MGKAQAEEKRRTSECLICEEEGPGLDRRPCTGCGQVYHHACLVWRGRCAREECAQRFPPPAPRISAGVSGSRVSSGEFSPSQQVLFIVLTMLTVGWIGRIYLSLEYSDLEKLGYSALPLVGIFLVGLLFTRK